MDSCGDTLGGRHNVRGSKQATGFLEREKKKTGEENSVALFPFFLSKILEFSYSFFQPSLYLATHEKNVP